MPDRRARDDEDEFDEDRPRRRRRDDDDDDEPRDRRRDDRQDDDADRPRGRRRSSEEDDYDDEPRRGRGLPPEKLRAVAVRQKGIIFCILGYFLCVVGQFVIPQDLRIFMAIPGLIVVVTATVLVFMLSIELHGVGMGVLLGILTLIPCLGLIVLLIVNQQATSLLKKHRVRVGLLGANMSDLR